MWLRFRDKAKESQGLERGNNSHGMIPLHDRRRHHHPHNFLSQLMCPKSHIFPTIFYSHYNSISLASTFFSLFFIFLLLYVLYWDKPSAYVHHCTWVWPLNNIDHKIHIRYKYLFFCLPIVSLPLSIGYPKSSAYIYI